MSDLTHFNAKGEAHMVDVSDKAHTDRIATARGHVKMQHATYDIIAEGRAKKGRCPVRGPLGGNYGCEKNTRPDPPMSPLGDYKGNC